MCLNPIKIVNKSVLLYGETMPKMFNYVKCGICSECQQNIKTEWMYRTYYEAFDTFNNGGYVIFDTLTYNEDECPWSKDLIKNKYGIDIPDDLNFRCFDYTDVQKFFKRLRKTLNGLYDEVCFTYKLTSEYGTKGCTHRPHYHIIFFVKNGNINPLKFSQVIRKSWNKGITDGVVDKGELYFKTNRLFKESKKGIINAVGYISKYISKDSDYSKIIRCKVGEIEKYFDDFDKNYKNTYEGKLRKMEIRRSLNQFSKVSKGYGKSALEYIDNEILWNEGKVIMPDSYKIKRKLSLPMYYYRKLFQEYDKENRKWKFTEIGLKYKRKRILQSIDTLENVYENKIKDALIVSKENIVDYRTKLLLDEKSKKDIVNNIKYLLGNRTIKDYVIYKIFYQDRIINEDDSIYSVNSYLKHFNDKTDTIYKLFVSPDKQKKCGNEKIVEVIYKDECPAIVDFKRCVTFEKFVSNRVLDSKKYYDFENYDMIDNEFRKLSKNENIKKQILYDFLCRQRKKMKNFDQ